DEVSVRLQGQRERDVVAGPDRGDDLSPRAEGRIEGPRGVVANDNEVARAGLRVAGRHELPIGLEDEGVDVVAVASDRGGDFAARAEGRVEAAVRGVADEREGVGAADGRVTG